MIFTKTPIPFNYNQKLNTLVLVSLGITVKDGVFVYKFFDKPNAFPFLIVCLPYFGSNIKKSIFCSAFVGEFLRITRSSLLYQGFNEKAKELLNRMKKLSPIFEKLWWNFS